MSEIKEIADKANVIISGYAVIKKDGNQYTVVNLNRLGHATVFKMDGSVMKLCTKNGLPLVKRASMAKIQNKESFKKKP